MSKRIHLVSANSKNPYGMEFFVSKAFKELGYEVMETDYRIMDRYKVSNRIRYITDAEFTMVIKGERICPEDIFACRIPTVIWLQDSVEINREANFIVQTKASLFDIVYSFNETELPFYRQFNKNSFYLPLGADKDIHKDLQINNKMIDIGFVGNLNVNRINMINHLLDKGIPIQYSYTHQEYVTIVNNTKINLNIGITASGYQQRVFEILCMGGFLLTNKLNGDSELLQDGLHLRYYKDFDELVNLCYYYNMNTNEAKEIAERGQDLILRKHLYIHRVKNIIDKINNL